MQNLPPDTGMAFVILQHLRHDAESMLTEILGRLSPLPVLEASDGLRVEPNHVYVMPAAAHNPPLADQAPGNLSYSFGSFGYLLETL